MIADGFKFNDYFLSVGRDDKESLLVEEGSTFEEILDCFKDYRIKVDLTKLLNSCPFIGDSRKDELRRKAKEVFNNTITWNFSESFSLVIERTDFLGNVCSKSDLELG